MNKLVLSGVKYAFYIVIFVAGGICGYVLHKTDTKDVKTETNIVTKTITKTLPAKIVYKDKAREISVRCGSVSSDSSSVVSNEKGTKESYFYPRLKLSLHQDLLKPLDVNKIKFGVGYFINKNVSIDLQTNIKLDIIEIGASLYF